MNIEKRDKEIRTLRRQNKKKWTLRRLGKKYHLSDQRIAEIINPTPMFYCRKHKNKYPKTETCIFCGLDLVYSKRSMSMLEIMNHIKELQRHSRKAEVVYERKLLIKLLRNRYKLTAGFIGKLLNRDLTTIKHFLRK